MVNYIVGIILNILIGRTTYKKSILNCGTKPSQAKKISCSSCQLKEHAIEVFQSGN
jgi:hypothetical protein